MAFPVLFLIALGLSMDAFAVAIAAGCLMGCLKPRQALRIALFFGGFQALMPVVGWFAGFGFRTAIASFDHWVAFGLLSFVGGKMAYESFQLEKSEDEIERTKACCEKIPVLLVLAIATSLDALAVGLSFSFLNLSIPFPAIVIGLVTFVVSFLGVVIGTRVGHFFEKKIELLGGIVLIGIGGKILFEHLAH